MALPHWNWSHHGPETADFMSRGTGLPATGVAVLVYLRFIIQPMNTPATRPKANVAAMVSIG